MPSRSAWYCMRKSLAAAPPSTLSARTRRLWARPAPRPAGRRRDQPLSRGEAAAPGVEQQEASGPVGVLRLSRADTALAEQRRLLVARDSRDRDPIGEHARPPGVREHAARRVHL